MKSSLRSPLWQTEIPHSIDAIVRSSSTLIVMGSVVLRLLLLTLSNSQIFFYGHAMILSIFYQKADYCDPSLGNVRLQAEPLSCIIYGFTL